MEGDEKTTFALVTSVDKIGNHSIHAFYYYVNTGCLIDRERGGGTQSRAVTRNTNHYKILQARQLIRLEDGFSRRGMVSGRACVRAMLGFRHRNACIVFSSSSNTVAIKDRGKRLIFLSSALFIGVFQGVSSISKFCSCCRVFLAGRLNIVGSTRSLEPSELATHSSSRILSSAGGSSVVRSLLKDRSLLRVWSMAFHGI